MPQFKKEIERLVQQKVIVPVKLSDWASPIVLANKNIRVCSDFKQLLHGIEGCANFLNDIIISAPTVAEHLQRLQKILSI